MNHLSFFLRDQYVTLFTNSRDPYLPLSLSPIEPLVQQIECNLKLTEEDELNIKCTSFYT